MRIVLNYGASSYSGWGVEALNTCLWWPDDVLTAVPDIGPVLRRGDPRRDLLDKRLAQSDAFRRDLTARGIESGQLADPVFVPLGRDLTRSRVINGIDLTGRPTIAFPYIEYPNESYVYRERLADYDAIIVASDWNREIVESWGYKPYLVHQAIDTVLFNPLARRPKASGDFRVFSGGKAEYRKGQDIVLRAFAAFAADRPDAKLVAAWSSPWPQLSTTFADCDIGAPPGANIGMPNFPAWAQRAGISPSQFISIPPTPNADMINILSDIDIAIFPNRIEGGTNQVAMECIALGIPTAITRQTGHSTLWDQTHIWSCPLRDERAILYWFIETLEFAYNKCIADCPSLPSCFTWPSRISSLQYILGEIS